MNLDDDHRTQACPGATWVFVIDRVGTDTYALTQDGEVSLVDGATLKKRLMQIIGGWHGLGGDDVGRT